MGAAQQGRKEAGKEATGFLWPHQPRTLWQLLPTQIGDTNRLEQGREVSHLTRVTTIRRLLSTTRLPCLVSSRSGLVLSPPSSTGAPLPQSTLITTELAGLDPSRPSVRRAHQIDAISLPKARTMSVPPTAQRGSQTRRLPSRPSRVKAHRQLKLTMKSGGVGIRLATLDYLEFQSLTTQAATCSASSARGVQLPNLADLLPLGTFQSVAPMLGHGQSASPRSRSDPDVPRTIAMALRLPHKDSLAIILCQRKYPHGSVSYFKMLSAMLTLAVYGRRGRVIVDLRSPSLAQSSLL